MGQAAWVGQEHPMAESPLQHCVPNFWGAFLGKRSFHRMRTLSTAASRAAEKAGEAFPGESQQPAFACPSRPAGSLCESTLHSAPQPGLQLAFPRRLQRGVTSSAATQSSSLQKAPGGPTGLGECFCFPLHLLCITIPTIVRSTLLLRSPSWLGAAHFHQGLNFD